MKRLLLIGGGHSHLEVVRRFGVRPVADAEITLIDATQFSTYSGMLPGLIAGHYKFHDCHVDLAALAQRANVRFLQARVFGIDTIRHRLEFEEGRALEYDLISIDVGSTPPTAGIAGVVDYALAVKPFAAFARNWEKLIGRAERGEVRSIVAVGGGAASIEILLSMQYRLARSASSKSLGFALVSEAGCVLPGMNPGTRAAMERLLIERNISLHLNTRVESVAHDALILSGSVRIPADATLWATGAGAPLWLGATGLALDAQGFIAINEHLASVSNAGVFAAGDCATLQGYCYPKSGVYAVRQGPILAENLRGALTGGQLTHYRPQQTALMLISTGDQYAVATYGRYTQEGAWVWRWKNYIDRKFMRKYRCDS